MQCKNSNLHQVAQALKHIPPSPLLKGKPSHKDTKTFTYKIAVKSSTETICRYCKENGHNIKDGAGKISCPKLIQKEKYQIKQKMIAAKRKTTMRDKWVSHIQETSGCEGDGWSTVGDHTHRSKTESEEKVETKKPELKGRYSSLYEQEEEDPLSKAIEAGDAPQINFVDSEGGWGGNSPIDVGSWGDFEDVWPKEAQ
mgnify:CR=1 FL=1|jgi:hypothetical protein